MARFVLLVVPLHGHVNPVLTVSQVLVERGHDVEWYLPDEYAAAARATGAGVHPIRLSAARPEADDPAERFARVPSWLTAEAVRVLPQVLPRLRANPPDVVVYDHLCVWGRAAATALGRPAAAVCTSFASNSHFSLLDEIRARSTPLPSLVDAYLDDVRALAGQGVRPVFLPELFMPDEPLTIVFAPRLFQPAGETFDGRFLFAGPSVRPPAPGPDPLTAALDGRPLAYVSMGTLFGDWPGLVPLCDEAFADEHWQCVVSTGEATRPGHGPVLLRRLVRQPELLGAAAAFVTHGGMNSVMEAAVRGVPLVVIPQVAEQEIIADRVAGLGLGVRLDRATVTAATLRAAVDHVASSSHVRLAMSRLRAAARQAGGAPAAADALVSYAARSARQEATPEGS
jgi:MGT family glycosyltransferase